MANIADSTAWKIKQTAKPKLKNPILIEGLPGIGNVGKIAVDFMIDQLKAKKLIELYSHSFPHCVFVNENNIVELPTIEVYYTNKNNHSILLLSGDTQPLNEQSCYQFCDTVLDMFQKQKGKEIITLGGIATEEMPKKPKVYCAGNNKKIIDKYKIQKLKNRFGMVGPIIGVSGLLTGLAGRRKIDAVSILAETYAHPAHLGVKGAREILKFLNTKLNLKLNLKQLDSEIHDIEETFKIKAPRMIGKSDNTNYIG